MAKKPTHVNDDNGNDDDYPRTRRGKVDPLVAALLGHLPPAHSVWPPQERQKWLGMLGDALGVIYKDAEPTSKPGQPHAQPAPGTVRTT